MPIFDCRDADYIFYTIMEYQKQLQSTNELVDQLTTDLNKSRNQVAELINHNNILLEELKALAGTDISTLEERQSMRQEMKIMKGTLVFGTLYVLFGGRTDLLALVALVWFVADVTA